MFVPTLTSESDPAPSSRRAATSLSAPSLPIVSATPPRVARITLSPKDPVTAPTVRFVPTPIAVPLFISSVAAETGPSKSMPFGVGILERVTEVDVYSNLTVPAESTAFVIDAPGFVLNRMTDRLFAVTGPSPNVPPAPSETVPGDVECVASMTVAPE